MAQSGMEQVQDVNPVPTMLKADGLTTTPSKLVDSNILLLDIYGAIAQLYKLPTNMRSIQGQFSSVSSWDFLIQ